MKVRLFLGLLLCCAAVYGAIIGSGGAVSFLAILRLVIPVIGILLGSVIAGPGLGSYSDALSGRRVLSPRRAAASGAVLDYAVQVLATSALLGFLIQFVSMMKTLENPDALWKNLAFAFGPALVVLVVLAAIIEPLRYRVRLAAVAGAESEETADIKEPAGATSWRPGHFAAGLLLILASLISFGPGFVVSWIFLDVAAAIIAVFIPLGMLLGAASIPALRDAFSVIRKTQASSLELAQARQVFSFLTLCLRRGMGIGVATGLIFLVKDWLDRQRYGPTLSLALISAFWCTVLLILFALPLEAASKRREILEGRDDRES